MCVVVRVHNKSEEKIFERRTNQHLISVGRDVKDVSPLLKIFLVLEHRCKICGRKLLFFFLKKNRMTSPQGTEYRFYRVFLHYSQ